MKCMLIFREEKKKCQIGTLRWVKHSYHQLPWWAETGAFFCLKSSPLNGRRECPFGFAHTQFSTLYTDICIVVGFCFFFIIFRSGQCAVLFKLGGIKFNLYKDKKAFTEKYAGTQNDSGAVKHFWYVLWTQ